MQSASKPININTRDAGSMYRRPRERQKCSKRSLYKHVYLKSAVRDDSLGDDELGSSKTLESSSFLKKSPSGNCNPGSAESEVSKLPQVNTKSLANSLMETNSLRSSRCLAVLPITLSPIRKDKSLQSGGVAHSTPLPHENGNNHEEQQFFTSESLYRQLPLSEPWSRTSKEKQRKNELYGFRSHSLPINGRMSHERTPDHRRQLSLMSRNGSKEESLKQKSESYQSAHQPVGLPRLFHLSDEQLEPNHDIQRKSSLSLDRSSQKHNDELTQQQLKNKSTLSASVKSTSTSLHSAASSSSKLNTARQPADDNQVGCVIASPQRRPVKKIENADQAKNPNDVTVKANEGFSDQRQPQSSDETSKNTSVSEAKSYSERASASINEGVMSNKSERLDEEQRPARAVADNQGDLLCILNEPITVSSNESVRVSTAQRKIWMHSVIVLSSCKSKQMNALEGAAPQRETEEQPLVCSRYSMRQKSQTAAESKQLIFISEDSIKIDRQTLFHDVQSSEEYATVDERTYRKVCHAQMIPKEGSRYERQRSTMISMPSYLNVTVKWNIRRLSNGNAEGHERVIITFDDLQGKRTTQAMEPFISSTKTPVELPSPIVYDETVSVGEKCIEIKRDVGLYGYDGRSLHQIFNGMSAPIYTITENRIYESPYGGVAGTPTRRCDAGIPIQIEGTIDRLPLKANLKLKIKQKNSSASNFNPKKVTVNNEVFHLKGAYSQHTQHSDNNNVETGNEEETGN
ncbi:hypothetical protein Tcan_15035 [Toxocara canis]|uniref:Uncharacterized protein n=1 Tax=Toxocara canis TaxID=6265 RepID=A0A0B2W162_TOXCA|nr:hypothetical protein Tcan_15035 [Toxocara canis]